MRKNISELKKRYESVFAHKFCGLSDISKCPRGEECSCKIAAEIRAYIQSVIPEPYSKLTIEDFTGKVGENKLISNGIVLKAKQKIIDYCWGEDVKLSDFNMWDSNKRIMESKMDKRYHEGKNIVIYSDSYTLNSGLKPQSTGKTLVAALIMQEAIRMRVMPGKHAQSYDWIEFSTLLNNSKNDPTSLVHSKSCDWLVVDDITSTSVSQNMNAFTTSLVNPFFFERIEDQLPTILVFRFNIEKSMSTLEDRLGVAIYKIVTDEKTLKISLCDGGDN